MASVHAGDHHQSPKFPSETVNEILKEKLNDVWKKNYLENSKIKTLIESNSPKPPKRPSRGFGSQKRPPKKPSKVEIKKLFLENFDKDNGKFYKDLRKLIEKEYPKMTAHTTKKLKNPTLNNHPESPSSTGCSCAKPAKILDNDHFLK